MDNSELFLYCNKVTFQKGITKYYKYYIGIWKPIYYLNPFIKLL